MLLPDRPASLKWAGDFTLPRFRAKLANQYLLHPDVAPGYEELYRSDLGERTINRKDHAASFADFSQSLRTNAGSTLARSSSQALVSSSPWGTSTFSLTQMGRSSSGASLSLADMRTDSTSSLPTLGRSSSVPTIGLRRIEAQPAAARLGRTVSMDKSMARGQGGAPTSPMSPEDRKDKEKELNSEAMSRRLWAATHGSEIHIRECIEARIEDPSISLKACAVPGIQKALKGGAKLDWRNDEWDGATLLLKAVRTNGFALVEYVMAIGADPLILDKSGRGVFHWCSIVGDPVVMEFLLNSISDQQVLKTNIDLPDSGGDTPLHLASYHGHLPIIRLLMRYKVDVGQPNAMGYSALDLAEAKRMWHIVHYLSEYKNQDEDKSGELDKVRNLVRTCNLTRANELKSIAALNPKPKPKAAAKKK